MARVGIEIYEFDRFRLDISERLLLREDVPIPLPEKAFATLHLLVARSGRLVAKDEIFDQVWSGAFVEENNLDKNISILRRALGEKKGENKFIETVRGHGYRFVASVTSVNPGFRGQVPPPGEAERYDQPMLGVTGATKPAGYHPNVLRTGNVLAVADWTRPDDQEKGSSTEFIVGPVETDRVEGTKTPSRALAVATVVVVLLGLSGYYLLRYRGIDRVASAPFETFKIKRYSDIGSFNPAAVSADGKFIAFTDTKYAIWLKNTATDSSIRILPEIDIAERSIIGFSPDDNYIYFRFAPKDRRSEIMKIGVFGGAVLQKLAEDSWSQPSLSPDGQQISFTRFNSETKVFSLVAARTDGSGERTIAESKSGERFDNWNQNTAWSPDSLSIACLGKSEDAESQSRFIQIFDSLSGSESARIRPDPGITSMSALVWLPDGSNLLVAGENEASLGQIYRYTISTEKWKRVTNDLSDYLSLSVTSDGKTVLATVFNNQSNLWVTPLNDPAHPRQITAGFNSIYDTAGVSWTADGRIVYATNVSGRWEIWMINADGTNSRQLTQNCAGNDLCVMPFSSPDGRYLVFQASRSGRSNIWRIDLEGSNAVQLTTDGGSIPFVTPDSMSVIYIKKKGPSSTLWQVPIDGGQPHQVTQIAPIYLGDLSPDGKLLAINYYDQEASQPFQTCVAAPDADKPEKCFGKSRSLPAWTADSKAFYFLGHDYSGVYLQPLIGKQEKVLEFPGDRTNTFAISGDRKNIVVARSHPTQDIIAITDTP